MEYILIQVHQALTLYLCSQFTLQQLLVYESVTPPPSHTHTHTKHNSAMLLYVFFVIFPYQAEYQVSVLICLLTVKLMNKTRTMQANTVRSLNNFPDPVLRIT
jgi:hypothetical protein